MIPADQVELLRCTLRAGDAGNLRAQFSNPLNVFRRTRRDKSEILLSDNFFGHYTPLGEMDGLIYVSVISPSIRQFMSLMSSAEDAVFLFAFELGLF